MWKLDWDDAFNNFVNVENPNSLIEEWREKSSSFKSNSTAIGKMELGIPYGNHPREKYDLFLPKKQSIGTISGAHRKHIRKTRERH